MLSRNRRLRLTRDFNNIFWHGRVVRLSGLAFKWINRKTSGTRLAVVVPSHRVRKATDRNRIKRQINSVLEEEICCIQTGIDGVVIIEGAIESKRTNFFKETVLQLLRRSKVLIC